MEIEDLYIQLYSESGRLEEHSSLDEFFPAPEDPLALKWNDDIEPGRWVTTIRDLERLRSEDAPLSYTLRGLAAIGVDPI
jgi:hypothetical protein